MTVMRAAKAKKTKARGEARLAELLVVGTAVELVVLLAVEEVLEAVEPRSCLISFLYHILGHIESTNLLCCCSHCC